MQQEVQRRVISSQGKHPSREKENQIYIVRFEVFMAVTTLIFQIIIADCNTTSYSQRALY
jgi:hypothetical protein